MLDIFISVLKLFKFNFKNKTAAILTTLQLYNLWHQFRHEIENISSVGRRVLLSQAFITESKSWLRHIKTTKQHLTISSKSLSKIVKSACDRRYPTPSEPCMLLRVQSTTHWPIRGRSLGHVMATCQWVLAGHRDQWTRFTQCEQHVNHTGVDEIGDKRDFLFSFTSFTDKNW